MIDEISIVYIANTNFNQHYYPHKYLTILYWSFTQEKTQDYNQYYTQIWIYELSKFNDSTHQLITI